jgi:hypothetical protein
MAALMPGAAAGWCGQLLDQPPNRLAPVARERAGCRGVSNQRKRCPAGGRARTLRQRAEGERELWIVQCFGCVGSCRLGWMMLIEGCTGSAAAAAAGPRCRPARRVSGARRPTRVGQGATPGCCWALCWGGQPLLGDCVRATAAPRACLASAAATCRLAAVLLHAPPSSAVQPAPAAATELQNVLLHASREAWPKPEVAPPSPSGRPSRGCCSSC